MAAMPVGCAIQAPALRIIRIYEPRFQVQAMLWMSVSILMVAKLEKLSETA